MIEKYAERTSRQSKDTTSNQSPAQSPRAHKSGHTNHLREGIVLYALRAPANRLRGRRLAAACSAPAPAAAPAVAVFARDGFH